MKKLTFTVTIEFEDKINADLEIREVAQNLADAIKFAVDHQGIAPEESETFTRSIEVKSSITNDDVKIKLI